MERVKKVIQWKPRRIWLESYILSIDENKYINTNESLDKAKSILESVCKTILTDKWIPYKIDESTGNLVKQTFCLLPVFMKLSSIDNEKAKSILNAFSTIWTAIWIFRNQHGFFSHGQDLEAEKFDKYLVDLAISSSDLLVSFLIIAHAEDLKDRSRVYYDENPEFNKWFDEKEEWVEIKWVSYPPSKTLFSNDIEAYKEEIIAFENDPSALIWALEDANDQEIIIDNIIKLKPIFSEDNFKALAEFAATQNKINEEIRNKLIHSGLLDTIEDMQKIIKPKIDVMNKIQEAAQIIIKAMPMFSKKK